MTISLGTVRQMMSDSGIVICVSYDICSLLVYIRDSGDLCSDFSNFGKTCLLCATVGYMEQVQIMVCYKMELLWLGFEGLVPLCYQSVPISVPGAWHPQQSKD